MSSELSEDSTSRDGVPIRRYAAIFLLPRGKSKREREKEREREPILHLTVGLFGDVTQKATESET
jgi:hypothetical protein